MIKKSYTTTFLTDNLSRLRIHKEEESKMVHPTSKDEEDSSDGGGYDPLGIGLPKTFTVKYLGKRPALGLWGIKHTREPVDELVGVVRSQKQGTPLPLLSMTVSERGVTLIPHSRNQNPSFESGHFEIDTISYGVQDLVYTRVFAMIVVQDNDSEESGNSYATQSRGFQCYGFVCDSRNEARKLTYALASAFSKFSSKKCESGEPPKTRFAIDLRPANGEQWDENEDSRRRVEDIFDSSEA